MYCPPDVNTGFIELVGPIQQPDLTNITVKNYPLSISFAPRTTVPSLVGNRLDESTENTCTYKGNRFSLVDVQICSLTNKGYQLPGQTRAPVAELIISFSANRPAADLAELSGILLCIPIYDSGTPSHNQYITQIIDPIFPGCKYTTELNSAFSGQPYQTLNNQTLSNCIGAACSDRKALAYTYKQGKCMLFESVPPINKNASGSISGTVNHNAANVTSEEAQCAVTPANRNGSTSKVATLESIFYSWDGDTTQSSLAYKTCFESFENNNNPVSRSLYVVVFPNGIKITAPAFQQLLVQLNGSLTPYMIPPAIRGGEPTLRSYRFNDSGNKVPTITSNDGLIYSTPLSSCTDDFKFRFEYFTLPPRAPVSRRATPSRGVTSISSGPSQVADDQCPYRRTTEYKCVPFNQLQDLSGNYVVPGNKTLDTILYERQQAQLMAGRQGQSKSALTTEETEAIIGGTVGGFIGLVLLIWIGSKISKYA